MSPKRAASRAHPPASASRPAGGGRGGAVWKGSISFGLVSVPVALKPAEVKNELEFRMLDRRDLAPIGYRKVNKTTGEEVPREDVVRGFSAGEHGWVLVDDEDLKRASPERTQRIDIQAFVAGDEIDPVHFDRPYWLTPLGKDTKGYALLRATLQKSKRVGIATVVIQARQHLAALFARGRLLVLDLLRYADELRPTADLEAPPEDLKASHISPKEVAMAEQLVESMVEPWKPEQYHDEYRRDLLAYLKDRARRGAVEPEAAPPAKKRAEAPVLDMMALLKQSLAQGRPKPGRRARSA